MGFDRLIAKIRETGNPSVVGLDPKLDYVPQFLKDKYSAEDGCSLQAAARAIYAFNKAIIDEICDIVPAIKPQAAYYEMYGWNGMKALEDTIRYARVRGMFVITDGKRTAVCCDGNNGMAKAGSGDVLAGIISALAAQGMEPYDAACAGVMLHAAAGDLAAEELGQRYMLPQDLIAALQEVL